MHEDALTDVVKKIRKHREESLESIPETARPMAKAIFSHHLVHYSAELRWIRTVRLALLPSGKVTD
jgi:hypothetical protein